MKKETIVELKRQAQVVNRDALDVLLAEGARKMLQQAIENEVAENIQTHRGERDGRGHQLVVRNGRLPERDILTGMGPVKVSQPRVNDRRPEVKFTSNILPLYLRRTRSVDALMEDK